MNDIHPTAALARALAAPFSATEVRFRPGSVRGKQALAFAYVDARAIMDRLDRVLGIDGWQDEYELLAGGSVVCRLRLHLGEVWIERADVGSPGRASDEGDVLKGAFSDALKRAAVKFGIGRYLYRLPPTWVAYDPQARRFLATPKLPAWALPAGEEGECIGAAEQQALAKLLADRGKTVAGLCRWLGLPEDAQLADLTRAQHEAALKKLGVPARNGTPK